MASRCCGNRLSLPNQYDTKTPRASLSLATAGGRSVSGLFVARPALLPGTVSRHESDAQRGSRNVLGEISQISAKKNFEIIFGALPTAGLCLPNLGQVLENVTPTRGKPQAVRKYRFLSGTARDLHVGDHVSFVAQGHNGVDAHCAPRRV